ncbi:MAG: cysteine--tRNA ligase [Thaumarchaeota archaeon]|nr:cysteine--tRNA ligase [Nitrososphaerota archaeon]
MTHGVSVDRAMPLRLFNSLGRRVSPFKPLADKRVTMYTCGPTVYNYAHIGNFRTFVFEDVLRRYLTYKGYKVDQVMNITDVEDRIIEGIKRTGKDLDELTDFFTDAFMEDLATLNVQRAEHYPRATDHIDEIVAAIESLTKKGFAYKAEDGSVYFSIEKFPGYGRLSGVKPGERGKGARTQDDHYEKMGANDFALWKAWVPEDGRVYWETSLGKGRPGWHIECSVMAMKYLGETLDIHAGALDLRFPHHENEIAQSEALTGKKFVKHWQHSNFLTMGGGKMSKSVGNIVTLRELLQKGMAARAIRLFLISAHYREELKLTEGSLAQAAATLQRFDQLVRRLRSVKDDGAKKSGPECQRPSKELISRFEGAMDDDLNVPKALAAYFTFERKLNTLLDASKVSKNDADLVLRALGRVDSVLGIMRLEGAAGEDQRQNEGGDPESEIISGLVKQREEARKGGKYQRADEIRDELKKLGVAVEDTPTGPLWRKLSTPS